MSVHNRPNPCSRCPESVFNIPESVFNIPGISVQLRAESVFKIVRNTHLLRPVMQCWLGDNVDVALGVGAHATNNRTGAALAHWSWPLSWTMPTVGTPAATYAFPNHSIDHTVGAQTIRCQPDLYAGNILEVGDFRDRVLVPYPYMHVSFCIHEGASGGPVTSGGVVVGVNCRGIDLDPPGVVAQIRTLQDSFIDNAVLLEETAERRVTFGELVAAGVVTARHYTPDTVPKQPGHLIRLDVIPISARGPASEIVVQS